MTSITVGEATPLASLVSRIATEADRWGGDVRLKIMAHGEHYAGSQGGAGVQICHEGLHLNTLELFRPLRNKIDHGIWIYACGTAFITPGCEGRDGDGNVLCSRLAQITQAFVRASTATQRYVYGFLIFWPEISFGRWEGTVLTYGPRGDVVEVENSPEQ